MKARPATDFRRAVLSSGAQSPKPPPPQDRVSHVPPEQKPERQPTSSWQALPLGWGVTQTLEREQAAGATHCGRSNSLKSQGWPGARKAEHFEVWVSQKAGAAHEVWSDGSQGWPTARAASQVCEASQKRPGRQLTDAQASPAAADG